jgi:hypothetical protein
MMFGELEHSSVLSFGDFWKMEKMDKRELKIILRNEIFLGHGWWDDFMMENGFELDWVWLKFSDRLEVSWRRSNKNERIKNKWKMLIK